MESSGRLITDMGDLAARLAALGRQEGQALLSAQLRGAGAGAGNAADVAAALLQQPQAQLRAHGLLAARLAGRSDLVLSGLADPGVWRQAACFLCQVGQRCPVPCFSALLRLCRLADPVPAAARASRGPASLPRCRRPPNIPAPVPHTDGAGD